MTAKDKLKKNSKKNSNDSILIDWSDDWSIGIQEIDEQHKILVNILNELHQAILSKSCSESLNDILNRLLDYTKTHFVVEESILRIMNYPGYKEHKKQHDHMIDEMKALQNKVLIGKKSIGFELIHFLKRWLLNHIQVSDRVHAEYLLSQGVRSNWKKKSMFGKLLSRSTTKPKSKNMDIDSLAITPAITKPHYSLLG